MSDMDPIVGPPSTNSTATTEVQSHETQVNGGVTISAVNGKTQAPKEEPALRETLPIHSQPVC